MTPAALRKYATSLPGVSIDIKWGADECFVVGAKMFGVMFEQAGSASLSFKADPERFLELTDRPGIVPAPYLARAKWVKLERLDVLPDAELKALLHRSYELVASKLPKKLRPAA